MSEILLSIKNLKTIFKVGKDWSTTVNSISLDIFKRKTPSSTNSLIKVYYYLLTIVIGLVCTLNADKKDVGIHLYVPYNYSVIENSSHFNLSFHGSQLSYYPLKQRNSIGIGISTKINDKLRIEFDNELWNVNIARPGFATGAGAYKRLDQLINSVQINYLLYTFNYRIKLIGIASISYIKSQIGDYGYSESKKYFLNPYIKYAPSIGYSIGGGIHYELNENISIGLNIANSTHQISNILSNLFNKSDYIFSPLNIKRSHINFTLSYRTFLFNR
ncbi:MAG: hypothetical protein ISR83_04405 [Candidatus Marinimicrobia bacterium]|nr:hypothetical protein [Candidatus Neomarinimicrobiota bacterium]